MQGITWDVDVAKLFVAKSHDKPALYFRAGGVLQHAGEGEVAAGPQGQVCRVYSPGHGCFLWKPLTLLREPYLLPFQPFLLSSLSSSFPFPL